MSAEENPVINIYIGKNRPNSHIQKKYDNTAQVEKTEVSL